MSMRTVLAGYLTDLCTDTDGLHDVKVVPSVRDIGELNRTTLVVKTDSYEKIPAAPHKQHGNFTVTLISPHQDMDRAEDDLDARLELLLPALFTAGLAWQSATQVAYLGGNLAYDIAVTSILTA